MLTKNRKIILILILILALIFFAIYFSFIRGFYAESDKVVGEYHGNASIEKFAEYDEWKIGVNKYGQPIFVDYKKAMEFAKKEFSDVIDKAYELYNEEYNLGKLNDKNFGFYANLIYQMPAENEEQRKRNIKVAGFFDIYENSLKRWIYLYGIGWERTCP